jgi:hypothetical protein
MTVSHKHTFPCFQDIPALHNSLMYEFAHLPKGKTHKYLTLANNVKISVVILCYYFKFTVTEFCKRNCNKEIYVEFYCLGCDKRNTQDQEHWDLGSH